MLLSLILTLIVLTLIVLAGLACLWLVGRSPVLPVADCRTVRSLSGSLLRWLLPCLLLSWILTRILARSRIGILRARGILRATLGRRYLAVLHIGRRSRLPPVPLLTRRRGLLSGGRGLPVGRVRKDGSQNQPGTQGSG